MLSTICPRLRARMALRGTSVFHAVSSAQAAQVRCDAPQMPQARGVTTRPAWGSLLRRMTSKPRNSSAWVQALTTTPFSMSTRTSRSPSTRPTGEMSRVCTAAEDMGHFLWIGGNRVGRSSDDEDVFLGPGGRGGFGGGGELDVAGLV